MIDRGPRFSALVDAVASARAVFALPLGEAERAAGWTDAELSATREALDDLEASLAFDAAARLKDLGAVPASLDVGFDDDRSLALVTLDYLRDDLDVASDTLEATTAILVTLRSDGGIEGDARDDLVTAASAIEAALSGGEYLAEEPAAWDEALARHGCSRGPARAPDAPGIAGRVVGDLVRWPRSRSWDRVVVYDAKLQAVRRRDAGE